MRHRTCPPDDALLALARGSALRLPGRAQHGLVIAQAIEHGMAPLLYAAAVRDGMEIEASAFRLLAVADMRSRDAYRTAENELAWFVSRAGKLGLEVGAFKGVTAAERWFPEDPAVRTANDVDVFLSPAAFSRFAEEEGTGSEESSGARYTATSPVPRVLVLQPRGMSIEVHQDPINLMLPTRQADLMWDRTIPYTTRAGVRLRVLDPSLALVQMVVNSLRDNFAYLLQVTEIGRALRDPLVDWDFIDRFVRIEGSRAMVLDGVSYVERTLGLPSGPLTGSRSRSPVGRLLVPKNERLGGFETYERSNFREHFLPYWLKGRRVEALRLTLSHLWPSELAMEGAGLVDGHRRTRAFRYRWMQIRRRSWRSGL